ncbi:MAG: cupin domain-containing protein [Balneolaceae bacterium]
MMNNRSKVIKSDQSHWQGVEKKVYKTDTDNFKDIHRFTLLGEEIQELNFQTRYFEIGPGGYSSLEKHRHPHSVIIIRGSGSVILDNDLIPIQTHDVVYIAPQTIHQFHADGSEELGFICIVDRHRDRPAIPDDETIRRVITSPDVLNKIKK